MKPGTIAFYSNCCWFVVVIGPYADNADCVNYSRITLGTFGVNGDRPDTHIYATAISSLIPIWEAP